MTSLDLAWINLSLFFERMIKHGHGKVATDSLLGALKECNVSPYVLDRWKDLTFKDEIQDMWFKDLEKKDGEWSH